ncbi:MAG: hypothetical protein ACI9XP_000490 [Lentimonas sp.]|jgi:hypothetical protein
MKNIIAFVFTLVFSMSYAQEIEVNQVSESYKNGRHNSLELFIPHATFDEVEKAIKSELKDWNGKFSSSKKEWTVTQATISSMGPKPFDVYVKLIPTKEGPARVVMAFDLGGAYLNSSGHMALYQAMSTKLQMLGVKVAKESVDEKLKEASKEQQKLAKEQESLSKENEQLNEDIVDYETRIEDAKNALETNKSNQSSNKESLEKKTEQVGELEKILSGIK